MVFWRSLLLALRELIGLRPRARRPWPSPRDRRRDEDGQS